MASINILMISLNILLLTCSTPILAIKSKYVTACEGSTLNIECEEGMIYVIRQNYGRLSKDICNNGGPIKDLNCVSKKSEDIVNAKCSNKKSCSISASNSVFGDPCFGTYKYLEVEYKCLKSLKREIACEGSTLNIGCGSEQIIDLVDVNYGRLEKTVCNNNGGAPILTDHCVSSKSFSVVESRCWNQQQCSISASNSVFGDPCFGTYKYLEVSYRCISKPSQLKHEIACEGSTLKIGCDSEHTIDLIDVNYGRLESTVCNTNGKAPILTDHCVSNRSFSVVESRCWNQQQCSISASNSVFGDPCVGTYKYLEVAYRCILKPSNLKHEIACEGSTLNIGCDSGYKIEVIDVNYGRLERTVCNDNGGAPILTDHCVSNTSQSVVESLCSNQQRCSVSASNSVFGDPCVNTYKYLEISYKCVKN